MGKRRKPKHPSRSPRTKIINSGHRTVRPLLLKPSDILTNSLSVKRPRRVPRKRKSKPIAMTKTGTERKFLLACGAFIATFLAAIFTGYQAWIAQNTAERQL